jgi:hypothetical protein
MPGGGQGSGLFALVGIFEHLLEVDGAHGHGLAGIDFVRVGRRGLSTGLDGL